MPLRTASGLNNVSVNDRVEDGDDNAQRIVCPRDVNKLLPQKVDDFDLSDLPFAIDLDFDEDDDFGNGVINLVVPKKNLSDDLGLPKGGHHQPYPSRTLFVRNIENDIDDSELLNLFEKFGDVKELYSACKYRGFVMISYYDIRAAKKVMRELQNTPLRHRKLDIHFSIPKDYDKDLNQGTLVVFNLDPSIPNDDLVDIFGAYGEIKEIRETKFKRHHRFIEYYDIRAAAAALTALHRTEVAGKRITLEHSRPSASRQKSKLQPKTNLEQDNSPGYKHQGDSCFTTPSLGNSSQFQSPNDRSPLQTVGEPQVLRTMNSTANYQMHGPASVQYSRGSNSSRLAKMSKDKGKSIETQVPFPSINSSQGAVFQESHSLQGPKCDQFQGKYSLFVHPNTNDSAVETLSGTEFLWGSPKRSKAPEHNSSLVRPLSLLGTLMLTNVSSNNSFPSSARKESLPNHHDVGSAPSKFPLERQFKSVGFISPVGHSGVNNGSRPAINSGVNNIMRNVETCCSSFGNMTVSRFSPAFVANSPNPGLAFNGTEGLLERYGSQRDEIIPRDKSYFHLDLHRIFNGQDPRTTLMIKNIPNKYTSNMLLAAIDEKHKGTYDFLYLPIDFINKCNMGYAFINMLSPMHIIPFYEAFNGKKWGKVNSYKIVALAYARIQGKRSLVNHFQNSSLMNEDHSYRPITVCPNEQDSRFHVIR